MARLSQGMGKANLVGLFQKAEAQGVLNVIGHAQDGAGEIGMGTRFGFSCGIGNPDQMRCHKAPGRAALALRAREAGQGLVRWVEISAPVPQC
jgi:hypothetical protein